MDKFIPLLSGKPMCDFTPADYREYIRTLFFKPEKKKSTPKVKKLREFAVRAKVKKKGGLSLVTKRKPKYITQEEFDQIANSLTWKKNDLFIAVKELEFTIMSHEDAEKR